MQLTDKLVQIAENELKVYNDGKFSVVENIEPFYGQEQGLAVVASNVTTVDHEVGVRLSSKNLVNILMPDSMPSNGYEVLDDNSIRVYSNRGYTVGVKYNVKAPAGAKIVISFNSELGGEATGSYNLVHKNGGAGIIANGSTTTMPENGEMQIEFARTGGSGNNKLGWIDIKNLQVEIGDIATPYTPYITDFSDCKVYARGKNLLNLEGREVVNFGAGAATTKRTFFNEKAIILGLAVNNNYQNSNYDFELTKNTISCTALGSSYGLGLDVKILPNTTYRFSCSERTPNTSVRLIEYDIEGNYIKNTTIVSNGVTTTENTAWGVFMFKADTANYEHYILNPQLEYGSVITEYEPPIAETEYTVAADGTVKGVKSFAPTMTLISESNSAIINANYIKDIDKVFEETITQIALSGGE
jgi:hypothetical protein